MITQTEKARAGGGIKLGILTAAWGRSRLTGHVLRYYADLRIEGVTLVRVAVWSHDDPDPPPYVVGWEYVAEENEPLGRKWNAGVRALVDRYDVDAVMIVGSDDLVSATFFDRVREQLRRGAHVISVHDLYIYSPPEHYVHYCESMVPGAGRVLSRAVLAAMKSRPWDDDAPMYLDSSITARLRQVPNLRRYNAKDMSGLGFAVVDVKIPGGPSLWSFVVDSESGRAYIENASGSKLYIRRVTELPAKRFFADHFPQIPNFFVLGLATDPYAIPE